MRLRLLSVREALSWVKQNHMSNTIVETNSQVVFHALTSGLDATSPFAMLIEDCQALANSMEYVCFAFVRRSANSIAHSIARVSGSLAGPCIGRQ